MSVVHHDLFRSVRSLPHPLAPQVVAAAERVAAHTLFGRLRAVADVRVFMEHHVWAVWDFMSLLKSVQEAFAPARVPWVPPADAEAARLVNEIVVGEECDEGPDGRPASHFAIYLDAMARAGADAAPIRRFVGELRQGAPWERALARAGAPSAARGFVEATLRVCAGPVHARVAALTLGREEIIPAMFRSIVGEIARAPRDAGARGADLGGLGGLVWYLDRHVAVDGDRHGPMTARLFERACARDEVTLGESLAAALEALARRHALWSAAEAAIGAARARRAAHAPAAGA